MVYMGEDTIVASDTYLRGSGLYDRTIYEITGNGTRILATTSITEGEYPFVYFHKMSETAFLATEINAAESNVKKYDLANHTVETLISFPYELEDETHKSGKVLKDACVSGNSIYALLRTLDTDSCYEIERYDADGNYIATLDSAAAKRYFADTPYFFNCVGDYLILHSVSFDCGVYHIENDALVEIVSPEDERITYLGGLSNCYHSEQIPYLFFSLPRGQKENLLYALDLSTSEMKSVRFHAPEQYIYAFKIDTSGNLILEMGDLSLDIGNTEKAYYYLSAEMISELFH